MIPIREYFNQRGAAKYGNEWSGEELNLGAASPTTDQIDQFSLSERAAYDRCMAIVIVLLEELEAGKLVAVYEARNGQRRDVSKDYWFASDTTQGLRLSEYLTDTETLHYIKSTAKPESAKRSKSNAGTKPKADWEAHKSAFFERCKNGNLPDDPGNDWGSVAAAIDWLLKAVQPDEDLKAKRDGTKPYIPSNSAARDWIAKWMNEIKATRESD